ncbi:MAG: ATP-binding protein [Rhodospirillales bacterium]
MYSRLSAQQVFTALSDTPVVLVTGPRRAGKTTLVRSMAGKDRTYITLDDEAVLEVARSDPSGFVRGLDMAVIDEIQRAPNLLLALKKSVDEDYRPGRFLLTGSANVLTLPRTADSLAGRMETVHLPPLARAEITGAAPSFLERLFSGALRADKDAVTGDDLVRLVLSGGFPEMISRKTESRRQDWARNYLESVLTCDLRDITGIEKIAELPKFVQILAAHSGRLINYSTLGAGIGVSYKTGQRYVALLEQIFLTTALQPWHTNALKRIVKTPKLHFLDSGLLAAVLEIGFDRVKAERAVFGALLESFVFAEVMKLAAAADMRLRPYHFRDQKGREADIVLERADGMTAAIEVKASATVRAGDFAGLRAVAEACGDKFAYGVVLYDGTDVIPFGEKLAAAPLSVLWG